MSMNRLKNLLKRVLVQMWNFAISDHKSIIQTAAAGVLPMDALFRMPLPL